MSTISRVATASTFSFEGSACSTPATCWRTTSRAAERATSIATLPPPITKHLFADSELVTQVHVEQKINSFMNAVEIDTRE